MAYKPAILLVKNQVSLPSVVCGFVMIGFAAVPQQTPRAVTSAPPSEKTFPPQLALVWVILVIS